MKPTKRKANIALNMDTVKQITLFAKQEDLSFSEYVNAVLKAWLENHQAMLDTGVEEGDDFVRAIVDVLYWECRGRGCATFTHEPPQAP